MCNTHLNLQIQIQIDSHGIPQIAEPDHTDATILTWGDTIYLQSNSQNTLENKSLTCDFGFIKLNDLKSTWTIYHVSIPSIGD